MNEYIYRIYVKNWIKGPKHSFTTYLSEVQPVPLFSGKSGTFNNGSFDEGFNQWLKSNIVFKTLSIFRILL
jgi:hypothetical protein